MELEMKMHSSKALFFQGLLQECAGQKILGRCPHSLRRLLYVGSQNHSCEQQDTPAI